MGEVKEYIHLFETENEYNTKRNIDYLEPWVSYTKENTKIYYNKTEEEIKFSTPLTFEITGNGIIYWATANNSDGETEPSPITIEYKLNDGEWTSITSTDRTPIEVVSGDIIQFHGDNNTYTSGSFSGSTAQFKAKGNIMSLINSTNFSTLVELSENETFAYLFAACTGLTDASELLLPATTLTNYCYGGMFDGCTSLTTAPELPATTLTFDCYTHMFRGCTSLTTAPELPATTLTPFTQGCYGYMFAGCTSLTTAPELPATTLAINCYGGMFYGCTSLTTAPQLPATTLAQGCYQNMFQGCTSLTQAPELPATTLADYCYQTMFQNCTSLTTAPQLPATTLADGCYGGMFRGCTNLTQAPELPATTLTTDCYEYMFSGCSKLNYIKCLATNISANGSTTNWVSGVSSTGTFVKNPSMTGWTTGTSGIPTGWTVQDNVLG